MGAFGMGTTVSVEVFPKPTLISGLQSYQRIKLAMKLISCDCWHLAGMSPQSGPVNYISTLKRFWLFSDRERKLS
jgi:hypothetical protein